jgi:hypothetical protein
VDQGKYYQLLGEKLFAQLSLDIDNKTSELGYAEAFSARFDATKGKIQLPADDVSRRTDNPDVLENPAFKSIMRATRVFGALEWMFKERQDILATFIQKFEPRITLTQ